MLVVIFILYVGTTVFPPLATGACATLTPSCPQLSENVICDKMVNVFLFLNITFPLGHIHNVRMRLEILSQTVVPNKSTIQRLVERFRETWVLVRNVVLVVLLL
jgi:hypothetical protein